LNNDLNDAWRAFEHEYTVVTRFKLRVREDYWSDFVMARKTPSSMATERVNSVAACPATAMLLPFASIVGPARFAAMFEVVDVPSPGCNEMREVLGVQLETPKQVSRTKT
jgi:hypothetical protein